MVKIAKNKRLSIVIVVLAILLAVSSAALAGTVIIRHFSHPDNASVVIPDNIIAPDSHNSSATESGSLVPTGLLNSTSGDTNSPDSLDQSETSRVSVNAPESAESETTEAASLNGTKASVLTLHNKQPEDNRPFQTDNMFPGDCETKYYCIRASYKDNIIVRCRTDIRPGYEKLAEVLKVKIRLLGTDEILYDGLMRDMPKSLDHALYTNESTQSELYYEITAYLSTSVGNEYMDKDLIADFRWWVEETDHLDSPQTGDTSNIYLWSCLAAGSLVFLLILLRKRRKEAANEAE